MGPSHPQADSLWIALAEECCCCFFLLSRAAHVQCLNQCSSVAGDNSKGQPSTSAPMGVADSFVRTTVELILSLCPHLGHPCLPKLILRALFIILISLLETASWNSAGDPDHCLQGSNTLARPSFPIHFTSLPFTCY